MACAWAGRNEPTARIARQSGDLVLALGTAGHVLDFDDTYGPGLSHISAPTAPAALVMAAAAEAHVGDMLEAYAAGFEAMATLARASHPALYKRGWHPTAVTGTVGSATAAAHLLGLDSEQTGHARRLAVLGAGGLRTAFGTDGKSLQVGMAASQGVEAAHMAARGATTSNDVESGFAEAYGGTWAEPDGERAITMNWIKAYPCCLQTHSSIEAAARASALGASPDGRGTVYVHTRSRQAAPLDDVSDGLEAKFSIPYTVAFTLLHRPPTVPDFWKVDEAARHLASKITVEIDDGLAQSEAVLAWEGDHDPIEVRILAAKGSPELPMSHEERNAKILALSGDRLLRVLDDPDRPASEVLALLGDGI